MVKLIAGTTITQRKHDDDFLNPFTMRSLEWFRPPGYVEHLGSAYGEHRGIYTVSRVLNLINLGDPNDRQMVMGQTDLLTIDLNPDVQYAGYWGNRRVQQAILDSKGLLRFDGTIMSDHTTDPGLRRYLAGPEEVVLFMDRVKSGISLTRVEKV